MAKKKKPVVVVHKVMLQYTCDGSPVEVDVTTEISSSESECDLCGSHGTLSVWINKCPVCKGFHNVALKEW